MMIYAWVLPYKLVMQQVHLLGREELTQSLFRAAAREKF